MRVKWIVFSFFIHIALVYCLFDFPKEKTVHQRTPFIELHQSFEQVHSKAQNISQKKTSRFNGEKKSSVSNDGELYGVFRSPVHGLSENNIGDDVLVGPSGGDGVNAEQMLAINLELEKPMQVIWQRIRAHIHYHADFFRGNIQGNVNAEILIKPGGGMLALTHIEGHTDLVEWVKMALYKSLGADFLKIQLSKKVLLKLFFRFVILPYPAPVQEFVFSQTQLNFDIFGYKDAELGTANDVYKALTSKKTTSSVSDWNFSKYLEPYKDACLLRNNINGCNKAIEIVSTLGLHQDAKTLKQHLSRLSNQSTFRDSQ